MNFLKREKLMENSNPKVNLFLLILNFIFVLNCYNSLNARIIVTPEVYDSKNEKVIICGVCKNVSSALPNMIKKIEDLGGHFKDYVVLVYENNSTDATKEILCNWASLNSKVKIISEDLTSEQLHDITIAHAKRDGAPCRMELIAYARNQILKVAMEDEFNDFGFVIMTDLDFTQGWQVTDVLNSFKLRLNWDCITANCVSSSPQYYDRYAYRDEEFPLGPEVLGELFWDEAYSYPIIFKPNEPVKKVYSAFGGIAIYKRLSLVGCQYSGYITEDLKLFYVNLLKDLAFKGFSKYKNHKNINVSAADCPIKFVANSGYDGPVVCEHCSLFASMALNGHSNIFVNPSMICRY